MGTLTYYRLYSDDPREVEFFGRTHLREHMYQLTTGKPCVYLICDGDEIYATDNIEKAVNFCTELKEVHVQEWESFQDAYAVALHMKDGHPLCFDNKFKLN